MNMRILTLALTLTFLISSTSAQATPPLASSPAMMLASVGKAVLKYFGKEGSEEAAEYMAKKGGRELIERVGAKAARQGDEAVEQVAKYVGKHGPDALAALDNTPSIGPILAALNELPEAQVKSALAKLAAGTTGRELAEATVKYGSKALTSELKHPGVGLLLVRTLGDDGAELATRMTGDQAITLGKHADDLAKLPSTQRSGVVAMLRKDVDAMTGFIGDFVKANPGKSLFTVATTTVILAEPERILGGDEIVLDADGNPILISKGGIAGRTIAATGQAAKHLSDGYVRPVYLALVTFIGTFFVLWLTLKLWHVHKREQLKTKRIANEAALTVDAKPTAKLAQRDQLPE